MGATSIIGATVLLVAALLLAEWRFRPAAAACKPLASAGFVALALQRGALGTSFGSAVLVALLLGWVGDVCLLGRARPAFLAGLVAFLASHLAYCVAFAFFGLAPLGSAIAVVPVLLLAAILGRPMVRAAPPQLRRPAAAYLAVISLMVVLAAGTAPAGWRLLLAATAFYFSDLAVARQRFLGTGLRDRLWGLPLYYGAQLLFAWCSGAAG